MGKEEITGTIWSLRLQNSQRAVLSRVFVGALLILCGVLGVLQYRWIGEVSQAKSDRLHVSLQASLNRLALEFNSQVNSDIRALMPAPSPNAQVVETTVPARYEQWKRSARHSQIFQRIAVVVPQDDDLVVHNLDLNSGTFQTIDWPEEWSGIRQHLASVGRPERRGGTPGSEHEGNAFEAPVFGSLPAAPGPPGRPPGPFGRREVAWLIFDLNVPYVRDAILPELVQRELGDYQVEVVSRGSAPGVIYESDPAAEKRVSASADASVGLFDPQYDVRGGGMRGRGPGPPPPDSGRWQMFARNRAGSLEAVVSRLRWRNLAVTAGVLLLMVASIGALIRYTRHAQRLAKLQMDFVAGVSHELRTPLTVIHTAAFNLRGRVAQNPSQVERYGVLIQQESGRLKDLVEQVLRFSSTEAGRTIQEAEPLSVESVITDTMESSKALMEGAHCMVEQAIEPNLPRILGDPIALKHALQNLLSNAAKYGARENNWIGLSASKAVQNGRSVVEIRVADHGPGIPKDEQEHIFDPFFRGQRAIEDQVHGTGLGLNLVKKIVEAHGGTIQVKSEPMKGAEFIVRIPEVSPGVAG